MTRFIEWDSIEVRVSGERLSDTVQSVLGGRDPIERIGLRFFNGLLRVEGTVRKFISVPFTLDITEIRTSGTTIRVPLGAATAGGFPIPRILYTLLRTRLPKDLVQYEEPATLVMSLDRFLPSFVSADVQKIGITDGGLSVTLGRGGADLPLISGGSDEHDDT